MSPRQQRAQRRGLTPCIYIMKPQELAFCSRSARVLLAAYHAWKEWTKARILGLVFDNPPSLAPTSCSLDGWRPLESG